MCACERPNGPWIICALFQIFLPLTLPILFYYSSCKALIQFNETFHYFFPDFFHLTECWESKYRIFDQAELKNKVRKKRTENWLFGVPQNSVNPIHKIVYPLNHSYWLQSVNFCCQNSFFHTPPILVDLCGINKGYYGWIPARWFNF